MVSVLRNLLHDPGRMRRAFFFWTVRESSSFEWFNSLMETVFEEDTNGILEVRHFLTSAKVDDRDLGAVLFHYAANAIHADTKLDILLGHRSNLQVEVGRPKWEKELNHVIDITKELGFDDCGVFLCGPEKMADEVNETCVELSKKESDFHLYFAKETF
jgi:predicted ferric reductase